MAKVFLWFVDNDFEFLNVQPYSVEPKLCNDADDESVEIPNKLWDRWNKAKDEFNAVQKELVKYLN